MRGHTGFTGRGSAKRFHSEICPNVARQPLEQHRVFGIHILYEGIGRDKAESLERRRIRSCPSMEGLSQTNQ
jgi:hypothetical protein